MFNILKPRSLLKYQLYQLRNKITISKLDAAESAAVKRPTPILLLRTVLTNQEEKSSNEWATNIQNEFSKLGYFTVDASITLPPKKDELLLQTCYQELSKATSDLSFFPPLLVSHGEVAARISQKFVSNKPVSGLVMIDQPSEESVELCQSEFPVSEFEPRFPICMISNKQAPEFLDGWIDTVELERGNEFKQLTEWMDDIGM
ncbi:hypothetical protein MFLAVUS_010704 [Mucor flavus]|uniref:Uncharacterized protein n=1 Tax=Mucor flavus TaxID=439312 RepID=A0ABP9ZDH7_9FUNG